ncbi:ATP-binding cassette domain-containing protein [Amycolatopsis sp. FU40]|uniref:ABC-F family ATP-binding cassette domain-containing protein n=1 Tax=Amycolatopsis sp. FU40 TaxID=2914159 RepID=UPI001F3A117C|nr:ABC-F family ATP-binding cassette domain-containing protein [Amycolatopsis sp. FU40]UKD51398.1 ATP-binding cassette domain-containing protein [Amycolatopsis sp. FU40]
MTALRAHEIVRVLGERRVLDGVSVTAAPGRRIGVIGENGTGKSTLLRVLAGVDAPDRGEVERPPDLGFLHQEMPFDPAETVAGVLDQALAAARQVLAGLDRVAALLAEAPEDAALLTEYAELLDLAQRHEAWDADRRAEIVLTGLGLAEIDRERTLGSLSGGQRGRLALADLLVRRPSAVLLDEPTNHLDAEAAAFLEAQLRELPGTVVFASHDRAFLDAVCTDILDLDPAPDGPVRHGGTYTEYLRWKRAERERWERQYLEEQEELEELRDALGVTAHRVAPGRLAPDNEKMGLGRRSGRVQNQISRRVRATTRRLDERERAQLPAPPPPLRFRPQALAVENPEETLATLDNVRLPGRLSLDRLAIRPDTRLLVTGPNGAGKSTLLLLLAGELDAEGITRQPGTTTGILSQDTAFVRPQRTARATYLAKLGPERVAAVPLHSLGLLTNREASRPVGELSVGQRRRLALALLIADPPHLLLLDEPTNHLSPTLCDELEDALGTSPGAIVAATHDRRLRENWTGQVLRIGPDHRARPLE